MIIFGLFLLLIFLLALTTNRLARTVLTAPMIFTLAGILVVLFLPTLIRAEVESESILLLGEIALALVLFTDATRISVSSLWRNAGLPARLLGIGMPLTIALGAVVAALLFTDLSIWEAAILAVILAPTDAGLGQVVVSSPLVPLRIRQALNVEAGLNDGLSVPFLMLFVALAQAAGPSQDQHWVLFTLQQIGFGVLTGAALGWVGGWLIGRARQQWQMPGSFQHLALLSLAVLCWLTAEHVTGGNGFIAAFAGGMFVKVHFENAGEHMLEFAEAWGQLLNFGIFFIFGLLVGPALGQFGVAVILYALLSLTLIRMLPVAISLLGMRLNPASVLFLGWFGPRGLASIVLGLLFLKQKAHVPNESLIILAVEATVLLSIFAHGLSANPAISRYARRIAQLGPDAPENLAVVEMPIRT